MDWASRLSSTITYATQSGFSDGNITYAAQLTARARVVQDSRTIVDAAGEQQQTSHQVATTTNITRGARVWLPGSDTADIGDAYVVYSTRTTTLLDGSYQLYILMLGK